MWDNYKMEVVIKKGGRYLIKIFEKEIIRFENEIVIDEIVSRMVHGWPYEGFQKIPHMPIPIIHQKVSHLYDFLGVTFLVACIKKIV